jgi:hypothetical protein
MAAGAIVFTDQFQVDVWNKLHDLGTGNDTIKLGLITSSLTPAASASDPRWGAGGSTDWSAFEVTPGGSYSTGGPTIADTDATLASGAAKFDGSDVSITQSVGNPTNARWGVIYNDTDAGKRVLGYLDLGTDIDLSAGDFTVSWNASGIATNDQA